jgi:hypothetical protein
VTDDRSVDHHVDREMVAFAIEHGEATLVHCSTCGVLVGVDEHGLACEHDHDNAAILDDERFDDVFEQCGHSGVIGRLRSLVTTAFE